MAGTLEHQVFEQVGEAGPPGRLVRGADVIPEVDRDQRQRVVPMQDDFETVLQGVLLDLETGGGGHLSSRGRRRQRLGVSRKERHQGDAGDDEANEGAKATHEPQARTPVAGPGLIRVPA